MTQSQKLAVPIFFLILWSLGSSLTNPNYCDGNSGIPLQPACSSCQGRCGAVANLSLVVTQCSCDPACMEYGDCCTDFQEMCLQEAEKGLTLFGSSVLGGRVYGTNCGGWRFLQTVNNISFPKFVFALTVDTCRNGTVCPVTTDISDVNRAIPVTDTVTGVHYINTLCAFCNQVRNPRPWKLGLRCQRLQSQHTSQDNGTSTEIRTLEDLKRVLSSGLCYANFKTPPLESGVRDTLRSPCQQGVVDQCSTSCQDTDMVDGCIRSSLQTHTHTPRISSLINGAPGMVYKNVFCANCQDEAVNGQVGCMSSNIPRIQPPSKPFPGPGREGPRGEVGREGEKVEAGNDRFNSKTATTIPEPALEAFSLTVLLDFNPASGLTVGASPRQQSPLPVNSCPPGQIRVIGETACRPVSCPPGTGRVGRECLTSRHTVTFNVSMEFTSMIEADIYIKRFDNASSMIMDAFIQIVQQKLRGYLSNGMTNATSQNINFTKYGAVANHTVYDYDISGFINYNISAPVENSTTVMKIVLNLKIDVEKPQEVTNISMFFIEENGLREDLSSLLIAHLVKLDIDLSEVKINVNDESTFLGLNSSLSDCRWLQFNETEFLIVNDILTVTNLERKYADSHYWLVGSMAFVCVENELTAVEGENITVPETGSLGIVTLVLMVTSMVCLLVRLLLQAFISSYQTYAGRLQFQLCLALFLAFFSLIISGLTTTFYKNTIGCRVVAAVMYWMFLSAFFWMVSIAMDTWRAFRPSSSFRKASDNRKRFIPYAYSFFAWVVPAFLVALVVGIDFTDIDHRFKPNLGTELCWFNRRYALLVFFGGPLACCILTSIILYSLIAHYLRRSLAGVVKAKRLDDPPKIGIYLRLFAVMCLSWVFGFLAAFVPLRPPYTAGLWYIFIALNASQGILIFISFVCRSKVLKELMKKCRCHGGKPSHYGLSESSSTGKYSGTSTKSTDGM